MSNKITFYLNNEPVTVVDPAPDLLLIDYLRSPALSLAGAKKGCGQGGCGACTVILSTWNASEGRADHRAINACLRPVCTLEGLAITTVEGTSRARRLPPRAPSHSAVYSRGGAQPGAPDAPAIAAARQRAVEARLTAIRSKGAKPADTAPSYAAQMNPVARALAVNNGTQCGYCSTGFVMNMSAFLASYPSATKPTKREIEDIFDGNICRCTGYRPILTAMKTFARDWSDEDEAARMKCVTEDHCDGQALPETVEIRFPPAARAGPRPVELAGRAQSWFTPTSLAELQQLIADHPGARVRLVHGNTSFGIYPEEFRTADVLVNIALLPELHQTQVTDTAVVVGAGTTYTQLVDLLTPLLAAGDSAAEVSALGALHLMARRTAGTIVRNAATLGGNTMLVLAHLQHKAPFPSDLFTVLFALDVKLSVFELGTGKTHTRSAQELVRLADADPGYAGTIVLLDYTLPRDDHGGVVMAQKVALRSVNSHSIVNATSRLHLTRRDGEPPVVDRATLVFGGINVAPWRAAQTEAQLSGSPLSLHGFAQLAATLAAEVKAELGSVASRMQGLPSEGFSDAYRIELAVAFLYKAIVRTLLQCDQPVPTNARSAGKIAWAHWPVSAGHQWYASKSYKAPVSVPYVKLMAMYQTSGQVRYTHEIEMPPTAVNGAFVQSRRALADHHFVIPNRPGEATKAELEAHLRERFDARVDLVTHEEIPVGGVNTQGMGSDQPLFSEGRVSYYGQVIAMVTAAHEQLAIDVAEYASEFCVAYVDVDWPAPWQQPITTLEDAIRKQSIFPDWPKSSPMNSHLWKITRPGSRFDWTDQDKGPLDKTLVEREALVDSAACTVIEGTQMTGGQVHFYMETQACVALPIEAERMLAHPSSQSPSAVHQASALALGVEYNQVEIEIRQLGGGYGGKTEPTRFVAGPTVVAAKALGKPVRLVMKREADTAMTGKRHPYYGQFQIAVDRGESNPADRGLIRGFHVKMWGDGGAFYDCSFVVSNCMQLRADNAYAIRNFETQIDVCRTNTAPNTAMRSFGDIQCTLIVEAALDDAAVSLGMEPADLRERNLYRAGEATPFGQALTYCYIREVWQFLKQTAQFEARTRAVDRFNRENKWRKRGLYMIPVKYGSGYNLKLLEQTTAVISIYEGDGSIIVNQAGVDMGQGVTTKVEQIASYILNVPMDLIQIQGVKTSVIPNPTSTGGSTGTAYNGEAVKQACEELRGRMLNFGQKLLKDKGDAACRNLGVDYWNYGDGWAAEVQTAGKTRLIWQNLVSQAHAQRESLVVAFNAKIRGGEAGLPVGTYKPASEQRPLPGLELADTSIKGEVDQFCGFTYSAACAEVEVDILTGEVKILKTDLVYDMGWSLNPALDVGQVEGAFMQGVGYVLTEKLVFETEGPDVGRLNTLNTWRYKPPASTCVPLELNVHLFPRDLADIPENPDMLLSAKEVGEPPLVLACSVFFAVKAAIRASRLERGLTPIFDLEAPATVQEVRRACELEFA